MVININTIDKKKYLSEIYCEIGNKISYEEFIIELEKAVFLWIRDDILGFGERVLPIPNEFYTFRTEDAESDVSVDSSYGEVCARIISTYSTREYKKNKKYINKILEVSGILEVTKVSNVKIGVAINLDTSIATFIEFIGHEMVHYFEFAGLRLDIPDSHGFSFKIIQWLFNKALRKHGYGSIKIQTTSTRPVNSIDPDLLTIIAKKYD